jgi:AbrB family looped-hinge helix DNA binding protein
MTSKGQITIPVGVRRELGLVAGDRVRFLRKGKRVLIEPVVELPLKSMFGVLKAPRGRGIVDVDVALANRTGGRSKRAAR